MSNSSDTGYVLGECVLSSSDEEMQDEVSENALLPTTTEAEESSGDPSGERGESHIQ